MPSAGTGAAPAPYVLWLGSPALDLLALTNQARTANGLAPLAWSAPLASIGQGWSEQLAAGATVCAIPPLAHNPSYHSWQQAPGNAEAIGENVGCAQPASASVIFNAWMASTKGHRENILRPEFTHIGIGWAVTSNGIAFATQDFAAYPATQQAAPPPASAPPPAPAKKIVTSKPALASPVPKTTPTPTTSPGPTSAVEPVANPVGALTASPSASANPVDTATPTSSSSSSSASGLGEVAPQPLSAQGAAHEVAAPNWVIPAGVGALTLVGGGAWIFLTRRRRLGA